MVFHSVHWLDWNSWVANLVRALTDRLTLERTTRARRQIVRNEHYLDAANRLIALAVYDGTDDLLIITDARDIRWYHIR